MDEQKAAPNCEHHWVTSMFNNMQVDVCSICRHINWPEMRMQILRAQEAELNWVIAQEINKLSNIKARQERCIAELKMLEFERLHGPGSSNEPL